MVPRLQLTCRERGRSASESSYTNSRSSCTNEERPPTEAAFTMKGAQGARAEHADHPATLKSAISMCDLCKFRDTCGNFLRPAPLARPCFRRHAAIARIAHLDRRTLGHLPVQPQWIGKRPRSELQKEQLPLRHRTHTCAFVSTFLILQLLCTGEERAAAASLLSMGADGAGRYRFSPSSPLSGRRPLWLSVSLA